jgi:hypothetical protein
MDIQVPKLNVNVGLYLMSLIGIGFAEHYNLCTLYWFSFISASASLVSILWVLPSYVKKYLKKGN